MRRAVPAELVAQRGNGAEYPENSLAGLRAALELGAQRLLVDVQLSREGEAFLMRDARLPATITSAAGAAPAERALDLAADELAQVDASDAARFGDRYAGTRVARLSDLTRLLQDWPGAELFVELRRASLARHGAERFITAALAALRDCVERCTLVSRDLLVIDLARRRGAQAVGWVLPDFGSGTQIKYEALCPDYLLFGAALLPDGATLRHGAWRWVAIDVDDASQARRVVAAGADFVASAHVRALARELGLNARPASPRPAG